MPRFPLLIAVVLALAGCSLQQAQHESAAARADMAEATTVLTEFADQAEAGTLPADTAPYIRRVVDAVERANAALADLDAGIQSAESAPDVLEAVGSTASAYVPGYGPLVGLVLTTAAGFWRAFVNRKAARNIAKSVQPAVNGLGRPAKNDIERAQTKAAKRIVDESQGKKLALLL